MKKFKFQLNTPLKVKRTLEDVKKLELAEALSVKNHEENRLRCLEHAETSLREEMFASLSTTAKIKQLRVYAGNIYKIRTDADLQRLAVQNAKNAYESAIESYMASKKDRQILEKLKEKQYHHHIQEFNRYEQKQSDESAINSFSRREGNPTDAGE